MRDTPRNAAEWMRGVDKDIADLLRRTAKTASKALRMLGTEHGPDGTATNVTGTGTPADPFRIYVAGVHVIGSGENFPAGVFFTGVLGDGTAATPYQVVVQASTRGYYPAVSPADAATITNTGQIVEREDAGGRLQRFGGSSLAPILGLRQVVSENDSDSGGIAPGDNSFTLFGSGTITTPQPATLHLSARIMGIVSSAGTNAGLFVLVVDGAIINGGNVFNGHRYHTQGAVNGTVMPLSDDAWCVVGAGAHTIQIYVAGDSGTPAQSFYNCDWRVAEIS